VLRTGDRPPGVFPPSTYFYDVGQPLLNNAGQIAFRGIVEGPGIRAQDRGGIWAGSPSAVGLVAKAGGSAPGTGTTFNGHQNFGFDGLVLNHAGQVAFVGYLNGPLNQDKGIFVGTPGDVDLLVRRGDVLPGLPQGATLFGFSKPALGDSGVVAFVGGTINGQVNSAGVWAGTPGDLHDIAFLDTRAPGTPARTRFTEFDNPVVNERGDVVFRATVSGALGEGVWIAPLLGRLELLVAEGQSIRMGPGDFRTVAFIDQLTGTFDDIGRSALSNTGEVAINLVFTDGSRGVGVFAVPAPGTLVPLVAFGVLAARRAAGSAAARG
jgi:hypothetical protein